MEAEASEGSGQEGMPSCPRALQMADFAPSPTSCLSDIFLESSTVVSAAQGSLTAKQPDSLIHSSFLHFPNQNRSFLWKMRMEIADWLPHCGVAQGRGPSSRSSFFLFNFR